MANATTLREAKATRPARAGLIVERLSGGVELIERHAEEWRALCAEGACAQPFFRPEWSAAYVRAFAADKQLRLLTVRSEERLRAVLPLIAERASLHGVPVRKLRSAANVYSCRFDVVHGLSDRDAAVAAIWASLRESPNWDVIELEDVPEGGAGETLLRLAGADGYRQGQWARPHGSFVALPALGAGQVDDALKATINNHLHKSLQYKRRKLERAGPLQFSCLTDYQPDALDSFYELESAGWKGRAGTAIACAAATRQFYDEVAREAAKYSYFSLYSLAQNGTIIAQQYCLTYNGGCYLLKPTYNEAYPAYSPGLLLTLEILRDLVARGAREFDFMSPPSQWKEQWSNGTRGQSSCYIFRPGVFGSLLYAWKFRVAQTARQWKQRRKDDVPPGKEKHDAQST